MEPFEILPLGSIVNLKQTHHNILIVSRAILLKQGEQEFFFDYSGCIYPQGLVKNEAIYFNHRDITEIVFRGYSNDSDKRLTRNILKCMKEKNVTYATVDSFKESK